MLVPSAASARPIVLVALIGLGIQPNAPVSAKVCIVILFQSLSPSSLAVRFELTRSLESLPMECRGLSSGVIVWATFVVLPERGHQRGLLLYTK